MLHVALLLRDVLAIVVLVGIVGLLAGMGDMLVGMVGIDRRMDRLMVGMEDTVICEKLFFEKKKFCFFDIFL